ncbi:transcriptional regulator of filamentous growth FLO8 [Echria macrotheca]|uniref:Transcriptional regulator of filamentous growth FLO8 n=1 Tax=Echria macrotheca TaxID=438768 RepID=A0AAJ0B3C6_9PEZI|nr:transcriptional regulator of filamentous growth FLO8 [Echria macrotheca]
MNNMANMANMGAVGGPVGAPMPMMNNNGAIPHPGAPRQPPLNDSNRTLLNTYIYEYFMRYGMYDCARSIFQQDPEINVKKDGDRRDGDPLGNGLGDDPMDTDSKDLLDQKRPDDLPAPNIPGNSGSCFLYEWFCLFWDVFNSQKGKGMNVQINQYVSHTQQQSRLRQEQQQNMLRNIRPPDFQQQYQQHMMGRVPNGAMNVKLNQGNLQRAAMANNQNPQAIHMLQQQQKRENPDPAVRAGSPGTTDNAPSPSKRPRLDGAPFNPAQGIVMPNGQRQGMPGQQQVGNGLYYSQAPLQQGVHPAALNPNQFQAMVSTNPLQAKNIAMYSANLQQHHGQQMPNKPMAGAGGPQAQGSPMLPQGPDGATIGQFYPGDIAPGTTMRPGPGAQATGSNHALQDYQMQLMLLEQQNKKRLMMARQEQDIGGNNMRGAEGPGGPGGPGAPPGGQGFQGTSPPGGRNGASPNPTDQMKRASQQIGNAANMGSPLPDGAQNRSSPNGGMNFMGGNMDPNGAHFGMNMLPGGQMNGGMRPPSSHPQQPFNGQMNPQQQQQMIAAAQRQAAAAQQGAQGGPGMQWAQGPNGQMAGQGPQAPVQGTPQQRAMPPPSAPAGGPANAANSRNATSSPQVSTAAPPTPQQGNKAAPKKKGDTKTKAKAAATKKGGAGVNAPTPAADGDAPQETPTPATPITPVNAASFAKNQNVNAAQGVATGQPAAAPPPPVAAVPAAPLPDQNRANNGFMEPSTMLQDFSTMDFANPMTSDNVLTEFDFDAFLNDGSGHDDGGFDFNTGFMEGGEIGAE